MDNPSQNQPKAISLFTSRQAIALSFAVGMGVGWIDLHTTEVTISIVCLLFAGSSLGFLRPIRPWHWAVLIVAGLWAMVLAAFWGNWQTPEPITLDYRVTMVELAIALSGSYLGAFVFKGLRGLTSGSIRL